MLISVPEVAQTDAQRRPSFDVPWHPALMRYAGQYRNAADRTARVTPCMLAAIVNRETGGQNIVQIGAPRGPGSGVGLTQITSGVDWSNLDDPIYPGYGSLLDPQINLDVCAIEFLEPLLVEFDGNHQAAFAAYNAGAGAVSQALALGLSPDAYTTGHDYGRSVFRDWIDFSAVSLGIDVETVDWSAWTFQ